MIEVQDLVEGYARNLDIIRLQTKGLTQEDSLLQLPFRSNCLNWVVGHILANRCRVLDLLGAGIFLPSVSLDRYRRESEPVLGPEEGLLVLSELITHLESSQERLTAALETETRQSLQRLSSFPGSSERPLAYWLFFFYFHDCYHVGQTEILRQAVGVDDKII